MKKKEKDNLFDNLPACAAEFIKLVIKKMRYRKKVRADVMAELAAHFEDELRDCKSDEEKQQKAQQLIADFGDVKLLAVLLRRAKKRCRPFWRTIVARTFQTVGVLLLCFIVYLVWFFSGKPNVATDYVAELNHIVRPVADESLNAAPLYEKAVQLYNEKSSDEITELLGTKYNEATAEQKQVIEEWLGDNSQALELVIAGTRKTHYWQKYKGKEIVSVLMPNLAEFRKLDKALRWRAWLSAEQGHYEDAFGDMKSCYRLGQHLRGDKILIEQLVGIAIEALAVQTVRDILSEYEVDSAILAALQKDLEQITAGEDFTVSMRAERLFMYDEIQRCFTEDYFGRGHLYWPRLQQICGFTGFRGFVNADFYDVLVQIGHVFFTHPNKRESREMANRLYSYWETMAGKSPAQIQAERIDIEEEAMEIIRGNIFLEILTPALAKVIEVSYRLSADVKSTMMIISILRYRHDKNNYPEDLDELIAANYLKKLPMDPFSDKPLVYKKTDDSFMLYSVGRNFKDDGGRLGKDRKGKVKLWADDGDAVFWPVAI
ncbi:MAG: hypothetical protein JRI41_09755 [Deltaproteobacteria bacterium]|nr:hypothetical protein [Deltaproteobacteria bacterium]